VASVPEHASLLFDEPLRGRVSPAASMNLVVAPCHFFERIAYKDRNKEAEGPGMVVGLGKLY